MAKGRIKIDGNRCKGCELCVSVCPLKLLKLHDINLNLKGYRPVSITDDNKHKCIGCANCAVICPDGAISIYIEEEGDG